MYHCSPSAGDICSAVRPPRLSLAIPGLLFWCDFVAMFVVFEVVNLESTVPVLFIINTVVFRLGYLFLFRLDVNLVIGFLTMSQQEDPVRSVVCVQFSCEE